MCTDCVVRINSVYQCGDTAVSSLYGHRQPYMENLQPGHILTLFLDTDRVIQNLGGNDLAIQSTIYKYQHFFLIVLLVHLILIIGRTYGLWEVFLRNKCTISTIASTLTCHFIGQFVGEQQIEPLLAEHNVLYCEITFSHPPTSNTPQFGYIVK